MGKASQQKRHARTLTHLVQARITLVADKHVCTQCGDNASLLDVSYEVVTQAQADQLVQQFRRQSSIKDMIEVARVHSSSEAVYQATLDAQRKASPQEHHRSYRCFSCMAHLLTLSTGIEHSGEVVLARLIPNPTQNAVFVIRRIDDPERVGLMNTPFQDVERLLVILRSKATA